jgi:uncharacterized protein YkwD
MRTRDIARCRPAARPYRRTRATARPPAAARGEATPRGHAAPLALLSMLAVRQRLGAALAGAALLFAASAASAGTAPAAQNAPAGEPATSVAACAATVAQPGTRPRRALRAALRCAVNAERSGRGLARLRHDRRLARAAGRHARDMVRRRYFAHERPGWTLAGRLQAAGWSGTAAAEAIAWGCKGRGSALGTLQAWLASPPHRAIVLGGYRHVGIGLAIGAPTADRCGAAGTWVLDVGS